MLQQQIEKLLVKTVGTAKFWFSLQIQNEENISYGNTEEKKKKEGLGQYNLSLPFSGK